jgi:hypothetical protein
MNIFISWSGITSMQIAEKLKNLISQVIQTAKPYYSPDMDKGINWQAELNQKLSECVVGLICLTTDNTEKPWILFEAGALSNRFDSSKVCSIVFGLKKSDVTRPLSNFQLTEFERSDFLKLMKSINSSLGTLSIEENVLTTSFNAFYPKFEEEVTEILSEAGKEKTETKPGRTDKDILEEILDLVRKQNNSTTITATTTNPLQYDDIPFGIRQKIFSSDNGKEKYYVGAKVFSPDFGTGSVIRIFKKDDNNELIDVKFDESGIVKAFLSTSALLQRV